MTLDAVGHASAPFRTCVPSCGAAPGGCAAPGGTDDGAPGDLAGLAAPRTALWGDGFAEDGWADLAAVDTWDMVDHDEVLRLFPRLLPRDGRVPETILRRLADHVGVRAWRLRHLHRATDDRATDDGPLTSMTRAEAEAIGARRRASVALRPGPLRVALGRWCGRRAALRARERADLVLVDDVLGQAQRGDIRPAGPAQTLAFAFLTGIHPAYLWPAMAVTHERGTAAGWLGIVASGRPALMPPEVADYFAEAILRRGGRHEFRDPQMARLASRGINAAILSAVAAQRRNGRSIVVRRSIAARWRAAVGSAPEWGDAAFRSVRQS